MKSVLIRDRVLPLTWLRFLIVVLLVLGVFFRFANLDRKIYWHDEAYTSLRVSGYKMAEVVQQVFDGREIGVEDLQKYQRLKPQSKLTDTIASLAQEDPQHPPLYYMLLRFWMQCFGNSVSALRSFSVLTSLLVFPCTYWLCLELFGSSLVGWTAIALMAVSPVHVLFAQEAREYCLWTVTILLSSASLLRAMRLKTKLSWGIYAVTLALSLYTYLFSILVAVGHGIYVVATAGLRLSKITAYLLSSFVGLLIFAPWCFVVVSNFSQLKNQTDWTRQHVSVSFLLERWLLNLSHIFIDLNFTQGQLFTYLILVILVGYSIYFLCLTASKQAWLFILTLIGTTGLALILPDLMKGGIRSTIPRYLFPCYLGIQLAVAYVLATQIISINSQQKFWRTVTAVILSAGIVSCVTSSQAEIWWNKDDDSYSNPQIAHTINRAIHPLLVSNSFGSNPGHIVSFSHQLEPKVRLRLVIPPNLPQMTGDFSDLFLFDDGSSATETWRSQFEQRYRLEPIYNRLWRLKNM